MTDVQSTNSEPAVEPTFDAYAEDYDAGLQAGLDVTGESKEFFARERLKFLSRLLAKNNFRPTSVLDYGCGTGSATPFLREFLGVKRIVGVDVSEKSLAVARKMHGGAGDATFFSFDDFIPDGSFDMAFCNGVFHHIPPAIRPGAIDCVFKSLRPGGLFALWENNPWNPGTRWVMSRCPFDREAITISPPAGRKMIRQGGFKMLRTDHLFIFPHALRFLRPIEPLVSRVPLGGQYQMLCEKT